MATDMRRLQQMELAVSKMPDLVTNTWFSRWLGDAGADFADEQICAGLPGAPKAR